MKACNVIICEINAAWLKRCLRYYLDGSISSRILSLRDREKEREKEMYGGLFPDSFLGEETANIFRAAENQLYKHFFAKDAKKHTRDCNPCVLKI